MPEDITTTTTPAAEASIPAPAATTANSEEGGFVSEALRMLAPHQEGAPKQEPAPAVEPPKQEVEPPKQGTPAIDDDEGRKAEEDIKRETASMPAPQKAAFTKLRYELRDKNRQLKAALDAQQQQGGEKVADPELTAEVERLRAENEAAKQRLSQFDEEFFATRVELTDEFRSQVTRPRDEVANAIGEISKRYESAPEAVVAAVKSADPKLVANVTADMNEFDRYRFYQLVDRYQEITRTEQGMRKNAKETLEKFETERRSKTEAQIAKEREEWKGALERSWEKLTEDFPILSPIEGADDWNQQIEKVKAFAAPDRFGKLTTQEKAETLYRAAAFPALVAELESARAALEEARTKVGKYEGASPSVSTSGGGDLPTATPQSGDIVTEMTRMLKQAGIS